MKLFLVFSKRNLVVIFLCTIFIVLMVGQFFSCSIIDENAKTYIQRKNYIENLGYKFDENSIIKEEIIIPLFFEEKYLQYEKTQRKAGYNLTDYKGKTVTKFTYNLTDYLDGTYKLNLLVYNGNIIGGDIHSVYLNNEFLPLIKYKE